ncbi:MAG: AmmeMemoRadiSam system protein A [Lachnospiraceae bacterium]|nr:AmmeMemoRadiSam system protein A [Lachnospiraceae bacterium]
MGIKAAFMVPHPPMIVPNIGKGSEKQITKTIEAYEKVAEEIAQIKPETIIITSPHSVMYSDYFHISPRAGADGNFKRFGAKEVAFSEYYDEELRDRICQLADEKDFPAGTMGEREPELDHGTMVPLWFIRQKYKDGKIIRIGLSGCGLLEHYRLGEIIKQAVEECDRNVVLVASGDLSHKLQEYGPYGYAKEGPEYDEKIMDVAKRAAFGEMLEFSEELCDKAAECGHRSFVIMAGALDGQSVIANVYSHEDVTGVGYGIASFYPTGNDTSRKFGDIYLQKIKTELEEKIANSDEYVRLARKSLESYILVGEIIPVPTDLPAVMLKEKAGAFVSIHKGGRLRGCIGTFLPTRDNIAEEIIYNAISASTKDPRFRPIEAEELPFLDINVDILNAPEKIASKDELDVKKYGVIVSKGFKRGLLLPDLEGVDTVDEQILIAKQKAGIREDEEVQLQRFEVVRHI